MTITSWQACALLNPASPAPGYPSDPSVFADLEVWVRTYCSAVDFIFRTTSRALFTQATGW